MTPPRVLFVDNDPAFFASHRLPVGRAVAQAGWDAHLAAPAPEAGSRWGSGRAADAVEAAREAGLSFHAVPVHRPWLHLWRDLRTLAALVRLYRRLRPDLAHHITYKPLVHGSLAARLTGVPAVANAVPGLGHVFTLEGTSARAQQAAMKAGYRVAFGHPNQTAIFQNLQDRNRLVAARLVERERTALIRGSGVDPQRFRPAPEPQGPPSVLLAARMIRTKGVVEFVEAARLLRRRGVEARFLLAGAPDPGNLASVTEEELRRWEAEGVVEWLGYREDMPAVLRQAHVVCLPSRYREGLPKVLLEGAATGRALVASDIAGCREIVRHGENGLLVPPGDAGALTDALERLLEDQELRREMGRRGRERVLADFTVERVVERHLEVYRELLERARRG